MITQLLYNHQTIIKEIQDATFYVIFKQEEDINDPELFTGMVGKKEMDIAIQWEEHVPIWASWNLMQSIRIYWTTLKWTVHT